MQKETGANKRTRKKTGAGDVTEKPWKGITETVEDADKYPMTKAATMPCFLAPDKIKNLR